MFEIPVLPVHGGSDVAVISRGFWEVGMAVVCSLKDLERNKKAEVIQEVALPSLWQLTVSIPSHTMPWTWKEHWTVGRFGWAPCSPLCRGPRMPIRVFFQLFWTDVKIFFGLELPQMFVFWAFGPFPPNSAHWGSLLGYLMNWTGHMLLGSSGPGSTPFLSYGTLGKSLNPSDSFTEWGITHGT